MVARTLTATQIAALRLPTREQMHAAASAIPQLELGTFRHWDPRPGSFLEVGPGIVRFFRSSSHLPDAARDRALKERHATIDYQLRKERHLYRSPMALLSDHDAEQVAQELDGSKRVVRHGKITAWSRRSRNRMQQQLNRLDYTPLFEDGLEPAMVTLTLPGEWEQLVPTPASYKAMVNRFATAYRDAWGIRIRGVWKMEFQERGAPHLHVLMTPPAGLSQSGTPLEFRQWLSLAWARAVGAEGEERVKHERAGTGIDYVGDQYRDPRRIAQYFGKHGFFSEKEYQNDLPDLWLEAIANGERGARFWGVWGLEKASAVLQLNDVGSANVGALVDPLGIGTGISRIIGDTAAEAEERHHWATDSSVARAVHRAVDTFGSTSADDVRVQRHMRKLSRSLAMRGQNLTRNKHGQPVLHRNCVCEYRDSIDGSRVRTFRCSAHVVRRKKFEGVDRDTGEIKTRRSYSVGFYNGGGGFLLVNDGARSAADIQRLLDYQSRWALGA